MKLYAQPLEHAAIKTICASKSDEIKAIVLSSLNQDFFYYEPCKAAFSRIHTIAKKRGHIMTYTELLNDPALSEEFRDILRDSEARIALDKDKAERLIATLDKYRKIRMIYDMSKNAIEKLKADKVDIDDLLNESTAFLTKARSKESLHNIMFTIGKDANALDLIDSALDPTEDPLFKTGFKEFDDRNGGLPTEGVFIMAATTSGGKSTVLMNMLANMYELNNISVANISLEMNEKKITRRFLSRLTKIPFWKFMKKQLSTEERRQAKRAWRKFHAHGEKNDCMFTVVCPTTGVTCTEALTLMRPYGYKVIGIDYIGLLEGADSDDQWRMLNNIARECKIFSGENHCLIILLAQLDDATDKLRYSKGMAEHADNVWRWNYASPEKRESKQLEIVQMKGRDQELFPFVLKEHFEIMSVFNPEDEVVINGDTNSSSRKGPMVDMDVEDEVEVDFDAGQS